MQGEGPREGEPLNVSVVTAPCQWDMEAAPRSPAPAGCVCVAGLVAPVSDAAGASVGGSRPLGVQASTRQCPQAQPGLPLQEQDTAGMGRAAFAQQPPAVPCRMVAGMETLCPAHGPSQLLSHTGVQVDGQEQFLHERGCGPAGARWGQVGAALAALAAQGVPSPDGGWGHDVSPGCPVELSLGTQRWFEAKSTSGGCPAALAIPALTLLPAAG